MKNAIGDINGDGRMDILIAPAEGFRNGGNHVLAWYQGPANPRMSNSWSQTVVESDANGMHTARLVDMDGDGDPDIVAGTAWSRWGQEQRIAIYFNRGGAFAAPQVVVRNKGAYTGIAVDIDNDGDMDLVAQDTYAGSSSHEVGTRRRS